MEIIGGKLDDLNVISIIIKEKGAQLLTMVRSDRSAFSSFIAVPCFKAADLRKAEAIEGLKLNTEGEGGGRWGRLRSCGCQEVSQIHFILDLLSNLRVMLM